MHNKKIHFMVSSALLVGMLTGCGAGDSKNGSPKEAKAVSAKQDELSVQFQPTFVIKPNKNNMQISYKAVNVSGKTKTLTFNSGLEADYIVYDSAGKKVKQYSDEVMSTQAIKKIMVKNNQAINKEFILSDLPNGQYKIELFLTAKEEQAKAVTNLVIKNSFANGKGIYVGQMDPHTLK